MSASGCRGCRYSRHRSINAIRRKYGCAVKRRCLPAGANPARQLSLLQPEATGATVEKGCHGAQLTDGAYDIPVDLDPSLREIVSIGGPDTPSSGTALPIDAVSWPVPPGM